MAARSTSFPNPLVKRRRQLFCRSHQESDAADRIRFAKMYCRCARVWQFSHNMPALSRCLFVGGTLLLAGCAHFEPQSLSSNETVVAFESRSLGDPQLHSFIEKNLGRELKQWPPKLWDLELLTLAAYYFHPS